MSYRVEIPGGPFSRERQDELARLLVAQAGTEPEEAALNVLLAPCVVTVADAGARNRLLGALDAAGFDADVLPQADAPAGQAPAYQAPPPRYSNAPPRVTEEPAAPRDAEPAYAEPVYTQPAYAEAPPPKSSNGVLLAIAAALAVLVAGLGVTALLATRDERPAEPVVQDAPPRYEGGSEPVPTTVIQDGLVDTAADEPAEAPPQASPASEYRLGYSPSRGVNWDVFVAAERVRYSAVSNRTSIPVRDVPSARHGDAISEVSYGSQVRTTGCLPRRDDGGRWCQVNDDQGWIYDLFLQTEPPAPRPTTPRPTTPRASAPTPAPAPAAALTRAVVVMGSYRPSDTEGLRARYAQAELAGVPLETGPSENYGMSPGYIVIVSGPYDRARADRVLAQVRQHVLDAFTRSVQ